MDTIFFISKKVRLELRYRQDILSASSEEFGLKKKGVSRCSDFTISAMIMAIWPRGQ